MLGAEACASVTVAALVMLFSWRFGYPDRLRAACGPPHLAGRANGNNGLPHRRLMSAYFPTEQLAVRRVGRRCHSLKGTYDGPQRDNRSRHADPDHHRGCPGLLIEDRQIERFARAEPDDVVV